MRNLQDLVLQVVKEQPHPLSSTEIQQLIKDKYNVIISDRYIRRVVQQFGLREIYGGRVNELQALIDMIAPKLNTPLRLSGDYAITSDWHIPCLSVKWFELLLQKSKKYKITNLIIASDFISWDILSNFYLQNPDAKIIEAGEEILVARQVIREINKVFKKIVWLWGNHENNRILRVLRRSVSPNDIFKMIVDDPKGRERWVISQLPFCYLDNIRVTHPKSYRQTKLSTAIALSYKYNCSVLQAHGHFFSIGYNSSGQLVGDTGGLFDMERIRYIYDMGDTTHPTWNNGFMIYKNKVIIPFGEGIGD